MLMTIKVYCFIAIKDLIWVIIKYKLLLYKFRECYGKLYYISAVSFIKIDNIIRFFLTHDFSARTDPLLDKLSTGFLYAAFRFLLD